MSETHAAHAGAYSVQAAVSEAMVALHKEQFGRGPTRARTNFSGPDAMTCILEDVLLPAERKLIELGELNRVRDSRHSLYAATADEFAAVVEGIVGRKVRAVAMGIDPANDIVFENFLFEPSSAPGH